MSGHPAQASDGWSRRGDGAMLRGRTSNWPLSHIGSSLATQAARMVFISYGHTNIALARQVEERLRDAGISCWFDENRIPVGERFVSAIGGALRSASVFLTIDSQAAAASYWVNREIRRLKGCVLRTSCRRFLSSPPLPLISWHASRTLGSHLRLSFRMQ